jgi:hypothetical protein
MGKDPAIRGQKSWVSWHSGVLAFILAFKVGVLAFSLLKVGVLAFWGIPSRQVGV